jgi:hypothetical protein
MRVVRELSDDEMIAAFVLAEVDSARFGRLYADLVGGNLSLYEGDDAHAKAYRREALRRVRGYGAGAYLFVGFPSDVTWRLIAVTADELGGFLYADYPTWVTLSQGSRLVRDGAANVGAIHPSEDPTDGILAVEQAVRRGATLEPIIAAALNESSPHVIAEGHTRATALVRALNPDDELVEVIVGYSPGLATWRFYGALQPKTV